jgi:anti-sigma factor RsiW
MKGNTEFQGIPEACQPVAELLAAWVDGGLHGDDARSVTRHVAHCERCTLEADELRGVLADLHGALAAEADDRHDAQFWQTMAGNIDAAIAQLPHADTSNVVMLPVKRWRTVAWAASGALAAAVLAVFAVHTATDVPLQTASGIMAPASTFEPRNVGPHWTDALQARMSMEDDPVSGDSDPIDDLEDLNDDEVQELATQLGEEG